MGERRGHVRLLRRRLEPLGFATPDFVLRSLYAAYQPLLTLGLAGVAALYAHSALLRAHRTGPARLRDRLESFPTVLLGVGVALGAFGVAALEIDALGRRLGTRIPTAVVLAAVLLAYATRLRTAMHGPPADPAEARVTHLREFALLTVAALGSFWWLALFADRTGHERALSLAAGLPDSTAVTLYSAKRLSITGDDIDSQSLQAPDQRYAHRYQGLRLLVRSGGHYFLLPRTWERGDPTYEIPESGEIRIDLNTAFIAPSG